VSVTVQVRGDVHVEDAAGLWLITGSGPAVAVPVLVHPLSGTVESQVMDPRTPAEGSVR